MGGTSATWRALLVGFYPLLGVGGSWTQVQGGPELLGWGRMGLVCNHFPVVEQGPASPG